MLRKSPARQRTTTEEGNCGEGGRDVSRAGDNYDRRREPGCGRARLQSRRCESPITGHQPLRLPLAQITRVSNRTSKIWLRDLDSNQDNQLQRLVSYQLDDPGTATQLS